MSEIKVIKKEESITVSLTLTHSEIFESIKWMLEFYNIQTNTSHHYCILTDNIDLIVEIFAVFVIANSIDITDFSNSEEIILNWIDLHIKLVSSND